MVWFCLSGQLAKASEMTCRHTHHGTQQPILLLLNILPWKYLMVLKYVIPFTQKEIELMIKQEDLGYLFNELDHIVEESDNTAQPTWSVNNERKSVLKLLW